MKEKNPAVILWQLAQREHLKLKTSVLIASIGVIAGIVPYIAASRILVYLVNGNGDFKVYVMWMGIGLLSYILKTVLYTMALSVSHKATFSVLKDIRLRMLDKLPKMPRKMNLTGFIFLFSSVKAFPDTFLTQIHCSFIYA